MGRLLGHRPSPAMVVALVALVIAMAGTSYAAIELPANSVGTKQLKRGAVTRGKIKSNAIVASKVKDDSLTGADIVEASLGKVPKAEAATNALHANDATSADSATNALHAIEADSAKNAKLPLTVKSATFPDDGVTVVLGPSSVSCDPGQRVISGGAKLEVATHRELLGDSYASDDHTWTVDVIGDANPFGTHAPTSYTVYAMCTSAPS
jgi:hypothetical protein